jgi:carbonic anhydrase
MKRHEQLLLENKAWSQEMRERNPKFFESMVNMQKPDFLWIGCSDSRVSPSEITQTKPGEIFIHRNVANLVVHTDLNLLSVMQYAVEVLEIKHIIVCGHYGCGGVKASMTQQSLGIIDTWLRHIKDVFRLHEKELNDIGDEEARTDRLVELNVYEQLLNIAKTPLIQRCWKEHQRPHLHGWVYDLRDGIIKPHFEMPAGAKLPVSVYEFDNL